MRPDDKDKQAEKREKRRSSTPDEEEVSKTEETALMEEFAELSSRLEADQITTDEFNEER